MIKTLKLDLLHIMCRPSFVFFYICEMIGEMSKPEDSSATPIV